MIYTFSTISTQINDLTTRLNSLETNLTKDIRTILEILNQQHKINQHQTTTDGNQPVTSHQPSESDLSFDLCGIEKQKAACVQRSVSQPEYSEEKSLLK